MNRFCLSVITSTMVLYLGCERRDNTASTQPNNAETRPAAAAERANVRFINADSTRPGLDLYFGDTAAFSNIGYREVTTFRPMPAERKVFHVRIPGASTDLASNSEGLWAGSYYTLMAVTKEGGQVTLNAISDGFKAPSDGKAGIRLINATTQVGDVDLWMAGARNEVVDGVDPDSASSFKGVDPSNAGVEVRREDRKGTPVRLAGMSIQPGKLYTILLTGNASSMEAKSIEEPYGRANNQ